MSVVAERSEVRSHIRELIAEHPTMDPAAVAVSVIERLSEDELRLALRVALPYLVRDETRKLRYVALGTPPVRGLETWEGFGGAARSETVRESASKGGQATKVKQEAQAAILRVPIPVGLGQTKPLGDCTADDLRNAAALQQERADQAGDRADGYRRLAKSLKRRKASTVSELSGAEIRKAYKG